MKYFSHTLFLLAGLGLAVNAAVAQEDQRAQDQDNEPIHVLISEYDTDGNMTLSREEFTKLREDRLRAVEEPGEPPDAGDQGTDSQVPGQENLFSNLDLDGSGELDAEELTASAVVRSQLNAGGREQASR